MNPTETPPDDESSAKIAPNQIAPEMTLVLTTFDPSRTPWGLFQTPPEKLVRVLRSYQGEILHRLEFSIQKMLDAHAAKFRTGVLEILVVDDERTEDLRNQVQMTFREAFQNQWIRWLILEPQKRLAPLFNQGGRAAAGNWMSFLTAGQMVGCLPSGEDLKTVAPGPVPWGLSEWILPGELWILSTGFQGCGGLTERKGIPLDTAFWNLILELSERGGLCRVQQNDSELSRVSAVPLGRIEKWGRQIVETKKYPFRRLLSWAASLGPNRSDKNFDKFPKHRP
jgi:hypothetical protein